MKSLRILTLAAVLVAVPALHAQERQTRHQAWTLQRIPDGGWIRVRNMNGAIRVRSSIKDVVEVRATKSWRRGNPDDVRIRLSESPDGSMLVCALWNESARCTESSYYSSSDDNRGGRSNDTSVEFEVLVPRGVKVGVWSVNGGVTVDGVTAEVRAGTVNGSVEAVSTGGPVQASTVNGSIHATMGRFDGTEDLDFRTVNGTVVAEFTGDIDADIDLRTVNGRFQTDWPVTITGRIDPRHLRATLGKGGRRISLATVNGNVELRKR